MNQDKLSAIAARSADNLKHLFEEHAEEIRAGIHSATEEAENQGKESIIVTLSHQIKLDLGKDSQTDILSISVRHKFEASGSIPDPAQPEFPLETVPKKNRSSAKG